MADPMAMLETMIFTEAEAESLVMALGKGQRAFTTKDIVALTEWAQETRLRHVILSMAIQGKIGLSLENGEVVACPLDGSTQKNVWRLHD